MKYARLTGRCLAKQLLDWAGNSKYQKFAAMISALVAIPNELVFIQ
jgi:hypothetical protein